MRIRLLIVLAAVVAACGTGTEKTADTSPTGPAVAAPTSTVPATAATVPATTTVPPPPATSAPDSGRPVAPEFTLTLSDGTEYRSSEEVRPVYLVFWAEW